MDQERRVRCNHCMSEFYEDYIDIDAISADSGETCPVCEKGDALMDVDSPEARDAAIRRGCADRAVKWYEFEDPRRCTGDYEMKTGECIAELRAAIEGNE